MFVGDYGKHCIEMQTNRLNSALTYPETMLIIANMCSRLAVLLATFFGNDIVHIRKPQTTIKIGRIWHCHRYGLMTSIRRFHSILRGRRTLNASSIVDDDVKTGSRLQGTKSARHQHRHERRSMHHCLWVKKLAIYDMYPDTEILWCQHRQR